MASGARGRRPGGRRAPASQMILAWSAGIVALLVAAGFLVAWVWVNSFIRGDDFRSLLSRKTSHFLRIDGEYAPLSWSGAGVYSDRFRGSADAGGPLSAFLADQIRARVGLREILGRKWRIHELQIGHLDAEFAGAGAGPAPGAEAKPGAGDMPPPAALSKWLPNQVVVDGIAVQSADVRWRRSPGSGLRGVRLDLKPQGLAWIAEGRGGTALVPGIPVLEVESFRLRYQHPGIYVNASEFRLEEGGKIGMTGEIPLDAGAETSGHLVFDGLAVRLFVSDPWRERLSGKVSGTADVAMQPGMAGLARASGHVSISDGGLRSLPVLGKIARYTRSPEFENLVLDKAEADFAWRGGVLEVGKLDVESKDLIRVTGSFRAAEDSIDGEFRVGVTPRSLRWLVGAEKRVFTDERDAYVWTTVKVSGPLSAPREDLSSRLIAAIPGGVVDGLTGGAGKAGEEVLGTAAGAVRTTAEGVGGAVKDVTDGVLDFLLPRGEKDPEKAQPAPDEPVAPQAETPDRGAGSAAP